VAERQSRFSVTDVETRAVRDGGGFRLTGRKVFVVDGYGADLWLVSARTGGAARDAAGISLFAVPSDARGVTVTRVQTLDGRRAAMLELERVAVGADCAIGPVDGAGPALEDAFDLGAAAACAEGVGVQRASLEMTVDYLKTREQFGVEIGAFQALQHRAVDMFIAVELASSLALEASIRLDDGSAVDERRAAVSAAKVLMATGGKRVTQQMIQLMGGIAITDEHDAGLYFKRMHALNTIYGDEEHHLARLAALPSFTQGIEA
jgi:alkylation response protein AidB-like acyl-CoA dehydrogenase